MNRSSAIVLVMLLGALPGCTKNYAPTGPRIVIPPSFAFSPGQVISYMRMDFDVNHNPVSSFWHNVEVLSSGRSIGGFDDAATLGITTTGSGGIRRLDTATVAIEGGKLMIYNPSAQSGGHVPLLSLWNTLIDLGLKTSADTLLSYDSTFTIAMVSGHTLRDRVTCRVVTRYEREYQLSAFGSPIINCFLFTRTVYSGESVDTAGVLLFQGPAVALLDSVWFGDGIGPVRWTSWGSSFEVDSLALPFSLTPLQVLCTASSFDSYEVHYARVSGRDVLVLRGSLYDVPPLLHTVTDAYAKNY